MLKVVTNPRSIHYGQITDTEEPESPEARKRRIDAHNKAAEHKWRFKTRRDFVVDFPVIGRRPVKKPFPDQYGSWRHRWYLGTGKLPE